MVSPLPELDFPHPAAMRINASGSIARGNLDIVKLLL
jgi:hypothetical protein